MKLTKTCQVRARVALGLLAALALAGCGASGGRVRSAGTAPARTAPAQARVDPVKEAIALLNRGDAVHARQRLIQALQAQPGDMIARTLLKQIDTDPKVLLGTENYSYTVKEGETMSILAERYLGDPLMAFALARYNGLTTPDVTTGQTILIPGRRKVVAAPPPRKPAVERKPQVAARPAPPPAAKPAPGVNPAQAARLRGQGLAAMNAGAINRAVALLRQALSFDPASALIKNDLARALRIQATLRGR